MGWATAWLTFDALVLLGILFGHLSVDDDTDIHMRDVAENSHLQSLVVSDITCPIRSGGKTTKYGQVRVLLILEDVFTRVLNS
jgi:hypothetical protein